MECIWGMFCWCYCDKFGVREDVPRGFCWIVYCEVDGLVGRRVQCVIVDDVGDAGRLWLE